jgi:lysophospholipase L1-like esterase
MRRILCVGDSNTFGHDPRSYVGGRYPRDVRWTGLLEGPDREVIDAGRNGACIPGEAEYPAVESLLRRSRPLDAVVLMLGTNDLLRGASAEEAGLRMEGLLSFIKPRLEGAKLLLVCPPPMERGSWVPTDALVRESEKLGSLYREAAARQGVSFADAGEWGVGLVFDGVHFSPDGHAAFARGLSEALDRTM